MPVTLKSRGVVYGFEPEDIAQERALGRFVSERAHPGDTWLAWQRSNGRATRHRKQEAKYKCLKETFRIEIRSSVTSDQQMYAAVMVHEILDLLPLAKKEEVLKAMMRDDGRVYRRIGREVREILPGINGVL